MSHKERRELAAHFRELAKEAAWEPGQPDPGYTHRLFGEGKACGFIEAARILEGWDRR